MFLQDTRIIQRYEKLDVHAQRFEIMFKDGTTLALHPVSAHGAPQMFLRALHLHGMQWLVFDLRHLSPTIEGDVLQLHQRDTPGVVFYTLRRHFGTSRECEAAILAQRVTSWWAPEPAEQLAA